MLIRYCKTYLVFDGFDLISIIDLILLTDHIKRTKIIHSTYVSLPYGQGDLYTHLYTLIGKSNNDWK